jgi:hypothetical protein
VNRTLIGIVMGIYGTSTGTRLTHIILTGIDPALVEASVSKPTHDDGEGLVETYPARDLVLASD